MSGGCVISSNSFSAVSFFFSGEWVVLELGYWGVPFERKHSNKGKWAHLEPMAPLRAAITSCRASYSLQDWHDHPSHFLHRIFYFSSVMCWPLARPCVVLRLNSNSDFPVSHLLHWLPIIMMSGTKGWLNEKENLSQQSDPVSLYPSLSPIGAKHFTWISVGYAERWMPQRNGLISRLTPLNWDQT